MAATRSASSRISEAIRQRVASDPVGALAEAHAKFAEVQENKHLVNVHRKRMQKAKSTFEEFRRQLEAIGIRVIIESTPDTEPQGEQSGYSNREGNLPA